MSEIVYRNIEAVCAAYKTKGYFSDANSIIGIRHKGMILWFRGGRQGYIQVGSTLTKGRQTSYHKLEQAIRKARQA